jgi:hypothetical protein
MTDFNNLLDIDDEHDVLGELEDLFEDLSINAPDTDQLFKMYGIFLCDIVKNPIIIKGIPLSINRNMSNHPVCKGKFQGFEHIITRESKYKGKRDFDRERANKVHWIRPIIENVNDSRIKYFERVNDQGYNQLFYWYELKGFIVIIREIKPDMMLITSFSIDSQEKSKFKNWYNEYKKNS